MSFIKIFSLISFLFYFSSVVAGDFDWMDNLSVEARADSSGFKAKLATRFNISGVKVNAVINDLGNGADAYMAMRLGEISGRNIDYVAKRYKANKGKGWGVLARSLGIKPGSREFKALKSGHDMGNSGKKSRSKGNKDWKNRGGGKNNGKGKGNKNRGGGNNNGKGKGNKNR